MLRILGAIMVVVSCTLAGNLVANRMAQSVSDLERIISLLGAMGSQLKATLSPVEELISQMHRRYEYKSMDLLSDCISQMGSGLEFPKAWDSSVRKTNLLLSDEDIWLLATLGDVIGAYDLQGQLDGINLVRSRLEESLYQVRKSSHTRQKLSRTLGLLIGIGFAILII